MGTGGLGEAVTMSLDTYTDLYPQGTGDPDPEDPAPGTYTTWRTGLLAGLGKVGEQFVRRADLLDSNGKIRPEFLP